MNYSATKSSQESKPSLSETLQFLTHTLLKSALHHTHHPYFFDTGKQEYKFSKNDIQEFQDITAQYASSNPVFQALANDLLKYGYKWYTHKNQGKRITRADQYEELACLLQKAGIDFDRGLKLTNAKGNTCTLSGLSPYMNQLSDRELSFYREPACTYIYNTLKDEIFKILPDPEELRKKKRFIKLSEELEKRELIQSILWDLTDTAYNLRMLPYKPEDPDFAVKLANELGKRWYYNELNVRKSQIRYTDDDNRNPENDPDYFKTHLNRHSEFHLHLAYAHSLAEHPYDYYRNEALLLQNTGYDFDPCNISKLNDKPSYLQHLEEARQQILQDTKQYAEENEIPFDPQKMNRFFDALTHTELENSHYPVNEKYPLMENFFKSDFPSEHMDKVVKAVQTSDLKEKLNKDHKNKMIHALGCTLAEYTMDHPYYPESLKILDDYPPADYSKEAIILVKAGIVAVEGREDYKQLSVLKGTNTAAHTKSHIERIVQKCENISDVTGDTFSKDKLRHLLNSACLNDFELFLDENEFDQTIKELSNLHYSKLIDSLNDNACIQNRDPEKDLNQLHNTLNKEQDTQSPDIQELQI